jgi:hypothetical protein
MTSTIKGDNQMPWYIITDYQDNGAVAQRQYIEAKNRKEARVKAGEMPTLNRVTEKARLDKDGRLV